MSGRLVYLSEVGKTGIRTGGKTSLPVRTPLPALRDRSFFQRRIRLMRTTLALIFALLLALCADTVLGERKPDVTIYENGPELAALPLEGRKIGIDPGHQARGNNEKEPIAPGSTETKAKVATGTKGVSTGTPEHVRDLEIAFALREILEALGAEVLMTRETADVDISNVERAVMMNEWGADAVLRIHCDGATDRGVHGLGMYVRKTGAMVKESEMLARCLIASMSARSGAAQRGVFRRDTYTGLNWSAVPCVLVECGYMTNPTEDELLARPEYQLALCLGMTEGLIRYFEEADAAMEASGE